MASIREDEGTPTDVPDGWKVDPKRTSFVEVGALKDQRSSLAVSLVSSTTSSHQLKHDIDDDDEVTIGDISTPGSKHSDSAIFVSRVVHFCVFILVKELSEEICFVLTSKKQLKLKVI